MKAGLTIAVLVCALLLQAECKKEGKPEMPLKRAYFIEPADGAHIKSPFKVKMGVDGMTVKPAGPLEEGTGHFHIIIGAEGTPEGTVVPTDDTHKHYGKGQTETELTPGKGKVKLTVQFADGEHRSYGPEMASTIQITVE